MEELRDDARSFVDMIRSEGPEWVGLELRFGFGGPEVHLSLDGGEILVRGAIDRVDDLGTHLRVVDYKTGMPPYRKDMEKGLAPQLPLEGMMLKEGGFAELSNASLAGLQFWKLSGGEEGGKLEQRPAELVDGVLESLSALIRHYDQPNTAYPASYRPPTARRDDYDHLARLGEWPN